MPRRAHLRAIRRMLAETLPRLKPEPHAELIADGRALLDEIAALELAGPRERLAPHWLCRAEQAALDLLRIGSEVRLAEASGWPIARLGKPPRVDLAHLEVLAARL